MDYEAHLRQQILSHPSFLPLKELLDNYHRSVYGTEEGPEVGQVVWFVEAEMQQEIIGVEEAIQSVMRRGERELQELGEMEKESEKVLNGEIQRLQERDWNLRDSSRKRGRHSTQAVTVLRTWFWDHLLTSTYPTDEDMMYLREHTQLDDARIRNWLINERRRREGGYRKAMDQEGIKTFGEWETRETKKRKKT